VGQLHLGQLYVGIITKKENRYKTGLSKDESVWTYAAQHGFTIISKDTDFHQRSFLYGHPPKVVWIRRGNCSTTEIEAISRAQRKNLQRFEQDTEGAFLTLE
jgi:predicted nuclease of predicted toxin-antitoxin system